MKALSVAVLSQGRTRLLLALALTVFLAGCGTRCDFSETETESMKGSSTRK